jgi:hypothetical protein
MFSIGYSNPHKMIGFDDAEFLDKARGPSRICIEHHSGSAMLRINDSLAR